MKNFGNYNKYPNFITCKEYVNQLKQENFKTLEKLETPPEILFITHDLKWDGSYIKGLQKDCDEYGIKLNVMEHEDDFIYLDNKIIYTPFIVGSSTWVLGSEQDDNIGYYDIDMQRPELSYFYTNCTTFAVESYLEKIGYDYTGKKICVVGRGQAGLDLANNLIEDTDATVTVCNSKTKNIIDIFRNSDLIITAIDKVNQFDMTDIHVPVIDIGLGLGIDNKLHGNVIEDTISDDLDFCATGINTIGPITRQMLIRRAIYCQQGDEFGC